MHPAGDKLPVSTHRTVVPLRGSRACGGPVASHAAFLSRTRDVELLAGARVDDGVVKGTLWEHGPKGLLDEMVLVLDQHLRDSLPAQGRLRQWGERLNGLGSNLLRPKLCLG